MPQSEENLFFTQSKAAQSNMLKMYKAAQAGHVGSSLSCLEMLIFIKLHWMTEHDRFVLSKGHAAAALYAVMVETGELSQDDLGSFYKEGTLLAAHPSPGKIPGIPFATGSLGHGLSLASGLALAQNLSQSPQAHRVFCIASDGELNEGSTWEAILFAAHHKLRNLVLLVDRNRLQGFGKTEDVMELEPLADKFHAFNWHVEKADGHSYSSLDKARTSIDSQCKSEQKFKPSVIICDTVKGRGIPETENTVDCHYLPLTDDQFQSMMKRLEY